MPTTFFPFQWMQARSRKFWTRVPEIREGLNQWDLMVLTFVDSTEAKCSPTELNLGDFTFFRLFAGRFRSVFKRLTIKASHSESFRELAAVHG